MIGVSAVPATQQQNCNVFIQQNGISIKSRELLRFYPQTSFTFSTNYIFTVYVPADMDINNLAMHITPNKELINTGLTS